jgi:hypothetical protein
MLKAVPKILVLPRQIRCWLRTQLWDYPQQSLTSHHPLHTPRTKQQPHQQKHFTQTKIFMPTTTTSP